MRLSKKWVSPLIKLGIGVGFGLLFLVGSLLISSSNQRQIKNYAEQIADLASTVNTAQNELMEFPAPSTLSLRQKGEVRGYVDQLRKTIMRIKPDAYPEVQKPLSPPVKNDQVKKFNQIVTSEAFVASLESTNRSLSETVDLLNYHADFMFAIANVLEYDPVFDTNTSDNEALIQRLAAAGEGLGVIQDKLDGLNNPLDTSKKQVKETIGIIEAARQPYMQAVIEKQSAESLKQTFIDATKKAQEQILANRQDFWVTLHKTVTTKLDKSDIEYSSRVLRQIL